MFSIKGIYENGSIKLLEPLKIESDSTVIVTFLDDDFPLPDDVEVEDVPLDTDSATLLKDDKSDEYYAKQRQHKRYQARGNITIVDSGEETIYPLNDYSAGGLSFFADKLFDVSRQITASLKYDASGEMLAMDFDIIVRGVFEEEEGKFKIGCQFLDNVDEELWHTIME